MLQYKFVFPHKKRILIGSGDLVYMDTSDTVKKNQKSYF
jgi:hypothetical protein